MANYRLLRTSLLVSSVLFLEVDCPGVARVNIGSQDLGPAPNNHDGKS
jgi:hypothetical protein